MGKAVINLNSRKDISENDLDEVDMVVIRGQLGVAENGASMDR